ncbi:hypothetical protein IQ250_23225, partial [Pseudanabaenaceae cyanobacterium LEGE 13415]|nr:hypothetical protein [Pseudanabaenaceae cyanobacterium LEGE 13415]
QENGNYRVVVDAVGDHTGSYGFSLIDVGLAPLVALDTLINGRLSPGSEDDLIRFRGSQGQRLFFDQPSSISGFDWVIYNASNESINSQIIGSSNNDFEIDLPADGEYVLAYRGNGAFTSSANYSVSIITPEITTTKITSFGSIESPNTISGTLAEKGEQDIYTFTGRRGQKLNFDAVSSSAGAFQMVATIFSPTGTQLFTNGYYGGYYFNTTSDPAPLTLLEDGDYRIIIDAIGEAVGSYSFNLLDLSLATLVKPDVTYSNTLSPGSEAHFYQFTGISGARVYIDSLQSTSNVSWTIYSAQNQVISSVGDSDSEFVLPANGTYYLRIKGRSSETSVPYSFQMILPDIPTRSLVLDAPITATLNKKGEQHIYTFNGTLDQRLLLDTLLERRDIRATLTSPSGATLSINPSLADDWWYNPVILPEAGRYALTIDGTGEATGTYSFKLANLSDAHILRAEVAHTGVLDPGSAFNVYRFEGNEGDRFYFDSRNPNSRSASWRLYGPSNASLDRRNLTDDFEVVLPGTGTYYLIVRGDDVTPPLNPINYTVQLISSTSPITPISLNSIQSGSIDRLGKQDVYSFSVRAGQQLVFDAITGNAAIRFEIQDSQGRIVGNGNTTADGIPFVVINDDTYRITIDGNADTIGDYSFQIATTTIPITSWTPPTGAAPINLNTPVSVTLASQQSASYRFSGIIGQKLFFDSLNTNSITGRLRLLSPTGDVLINTWYSSEPEPVVLTQNGEYYLVLENTDIGTNVVNFQLLSNIGATPLALDTEVIGTFSSTRETDWYRFTAPAGTYLYIDGQTGNSWDEYILYAPNGRRITSNWVVSNQELMLPTSGEYLLAVRAGGFGSSYRLSLITPTIAPATSYRIGDTVADTISEPGEFDTYTFTGTAGQRLFIDGIRGTNGTTLSILSPSAQTVTSLGTASDRSVFTLTETGTYQIIVDISSEQTGQYSFRVLDTANARPVSLDTPITQSVEANQVQLLQFTGSKNQYLYIFNQATNGWYWELYRADNQSQAWNWANADREIPLPADGTYLLALYGSSGGNAIYTVELVTPDFVTQPIEIGKTITGTITELGEQDVYTFTGAIGDRLLWDNLLGSGNLTATIRTPGGELLQNATSTISSFSLDAAPAPFTLTESGVYQIIIDGNQRAREPYSFRLLNLNAAINFSLDTPISGQIVQGREAQIYQFQGTRDQLLFFDKNGTWRQGAETGASWILYAPGNQAIASPAWWSPDIEIRLPADGVYTLVINGATNNTASEAFQFEVVTPEITTVAYALGSTVNSTIGEAGEQDVYTFKGTVGQRLFWDHLSGLSGITTRLIAPSGAQVLNTTTVSD